MKTEAATTVVVGLTAIIALLGGMFGLAVAIKALFFKPINPGNEFITRAEMDKTVSELDRKIESLRTDLRQQIKELSDYQRETSHRATDAMTAMSMKLTALMVTNEVVLGIKTPRKPQQPIPEAPA